MLVLEIQLRRDLNPDTELSTIFFLDFSAKRAQTSSFSFDTSIPITRLSPWFRGEYSFLIEQKSFYQLVG